MRILQSAAGTDQQQINTPLEPRGSREGIVPQRSTPWESVAYAPALACIKAQSSGILFLLF